MTNMKLEEENEKEKEKEKEKEPPQKKESSSQKKEASPHKKDFSPNKKDSVPQKRESSPQKRETSPHKSTQKAITLSSNTSSNAVSSSSGTGGPDTGIENMYRIYEKLNSAEDKSPLEAEFQELLQSVHRSEKEKRLASQFITRFVEYFPGQNPNAINAMLDLCEHDDVSMRRQVVKDLVTVCKKVNTFVPKIADVFGQLMQTSDVSELAALQSCLTSLFHIDGQGALVGTFSQIRTGEAVVRERCIKFICGKLKELSPEITTLEFEKLFFSQVKRILRKVNRTQFESLVTGLKETKFFRQLNGQQSLVDVLAEQLDMKTKFDPSRIDEIQLLIAILKQALPIFSSQISATPFVVFLCTKVIPEFRGKLTQDLSCRVNHEILRLAADITTEVRQIDDKDLVLCLDALFDELVDSMPRPVEDGQEHPDFQFSRLEAMLYIFHKLSHHKTDYLTTDEDRLQDFRSRMQYLARGAQTFMKKLREDLEGKRGEALKTDETRIKIISLKMTANISAMIRDMFHMPPIFKVHIPLSWAARTVNRSGTALKRARPSTAPGHFPGREREIYQPPSGKFSSRAGAYTSPVRQPWGGRNARNRGFGGRRLSRGGKY